MVGELGDTEELDVECAEVLKPYFMRDDCMFIFSTDFCHWGSHYGFTPFKNEPDINKHIEILDREGIQCIFEKEAKKFIDYLHKTRNNICGQNVMRVLIQLAKMKGGEFRELKYKQGRKVSQVSELSVTYYSSAFYSD